MNGRTSESLSRDRDIVRGIITFADMLDTRPDDDLTGRYKVLLEIALACLFQIQGPCEAQEELKQVDEEELI